MRYAVTYRRRCLLLPWVRVWRVVFCMNAASAERLVHKFERRYGAENVCWFKNLCCVTKGA